MGATSSSAIGSAEIIAVGSEMLGAARLDTNSLYITRRLNEAGIAVRAKAVVGDSADDLAAVLTGALARAGLIVLTGGLGPTDDDVTRDAVSRVLRRPLHEDPAILERLRARFAARGLDMPPLNRRQAMVPDGAEVIPNPHGTAPGLWIEEPERIVVLLPGPPRELEPMVDVLVRERLEKRGGGFRLLTRIARIAGRTESHAEMAAQPLYERWRQDGRAIEVTILAAPGTIDFYLTVRVFDVAQGAAVLEGAVANLRDVFGEDLYSGTGQPMEEVVGSLLREGGQTIAVAESCTGGLLLSRLTDVPGSSAYVDRGIVAYSNDAKVAWLGVGADLIAAHGAVSEPVAEAMAAGLRSRANATIAVGVTGIAGPAGGTADKPVGTVVIAVEGPWGRSVRTRRFSGGRELIKWHASSAAMDDVRRALLRARGGR
jgi:nicotinamide-nucleotide amidase